MDDDLRNKLRQDLLEFDSGFAEHYSNSQDIALQEDIAPALESRAKERGFLQSATNTASSIAGDVATGLVQAPRSAIRGVTKGVNSAISFLDNISDITPTISLYNEEGNLSFPSITTQGEFEKRATKRAKDKGKDVDFTQTPQIPVINEPANKSITGDIIEAISQFAVGFKGIDKIGKAAGVKEASTRAGQFAQRVTEGAAADVLAFDEHEQRLSNIIQQVPELQNPITEYLAADENDSFLEGKVKQAIEGLSLGAFGDIILEGARVIKRGRAAGNNGDIIEPSLEEAAGLKFDKTKLDVLGDAESDELILRTVKKQEDSNVSRISNKIAKSEKETTGISPDQVVRGSEQASDDVNIKINFSRIEGPEDIPRLMQELANDPDLYKSVNIARRGVQTDEQLLKAADDVDGFKELINRRKGEAFNDRQTIAARKIYYDTTERLLEAAKRASGADASTVDQFAFRKLIAIHHAVQQELLGARAEAARALRAWSIPIGAGDVESIRQIEGLVNEFGGGEATKDLARRLTAISSTGKLTTSQINKTVNAGALSRTRKALEEAWTLGLLTSPRTHIVNVASNVMTGLLLGAERASAGLLKDSPIEFREGLEFYAAYFGNFKEAISNGAEAWRTGNVGIGLGKVDLPPQRSTSREVLDPDGKAGIFSKAVDLYGAALNRYVGGALAAGDEFSKTLLYKSQLRSLAFRQGRSLGLNGQELKEHIANTLSDVPSNLRADAIEFANYGTYTNALQGAGSHVQKAIANVPLARFVVPFVRTPINIFKFTFERTPLGLLSSRTREDISSGGLRRAQALARLGTGTSVMYLGVDLSLNGQITGAGPTDPGVRGKLRSNGWQPYSVKIGDKYYSYARWEPFATWLGMSADISEIMTNYESYDIDSQDEVDELIVAAVAAISNQVVGKTFLQGISDMTQVLSDSVRYGPRFLQQYAGSLVPTVVADIERAVNPEVSQVFNMIDAMKARIPGLSDQVPPRRNVYGDVIKSFYPSEDNAAKALGERAMSIFNPVYFTDADNPDNPLDQYFLKNGFSGPNMPQKVQKFDVPGAFGERVAIDLRQYPEIYSRFLEKRGEVRLLEYGNMTMKERLLSLVNQDIPESRLFFNPRLFDLDKQEQYISNIVSDYDKRIRSELVEEFPVLRQTISEERALSRVINTNRGSQGLVREKPFP